MTLKFLTCGGFCFEIPQDLERKKKQFENKKYCEIFKNTFRFQWKDQIKRMK